MSTSRHILRLPVEADAVIVVTAESDFMDVDDGDDGLTPVIVAKRPALLEVRCKAGLLRCTVTDLEVG